MLFSLKMAILLHKWEFKNIEVKCLEMSETVWLPGLPDIRISKSCDFWFRQLVQALLSVLIRITSMRQF